MIQIDKIEIRYFRSIYHLKLNNLSDITILAGANDVGKSNILKALNLFFNNKTDWNTPFEFNKDFSRRRLLEVRKDTIKGKQYIQITVGFIRGPKSEKSLPERFTLTRTWHRDSIHPDEKNSIVYQFSQGEIETKNRHRALASLQRYLNYIKYEYIPAIKDQNYFSYILGQIQDVVLEKQTGKSGIKGSIQQLNADIGGELSLLRHEFEKVSGVNTDIQFPAQLNLLFRALFIETGSGDEKIPLSLRGDGVRLRFIPSLLNYISQNSRLTYIWGFEEPENSLEHSLATKLANDILKEYSKCAQILMTTHSSAFFNMKNDKTSILRIYKDNEQTEKGVVHAPRKPSKINNIENDILLKDIGLMDFQIQQEEKYKERLNIIEEEKNALEEIKQKMISETRPILLTEGKWDKKILEEAWSKLYKNRRCNFRIIQCDTMPQDTGGGAGGANTLKKSLESVRPDQPFSIGLFDRDKEGINNYKNMSHNFEEIEINNEKFKIQKNGTSAAILLPIIKGKKVYADAKNLVLEFYFEEEYLTQKHNKKGIKFKNPNATTKIDDTQIEIKKERLMQPQYRIITQDSKKIFAEEVVPELPKKAFLCFDSLFNLIEVIFKELEKRKRKQR